VNELALFAGAGGGILGGHLLGWRTVCAVEWEPYAASVLAARQNDGVLPPFPIWDDVRTFDGRPWRGVVDVVSGGFPCQAYSSAARGRNVADDLWPEMRRIVADVAPRYVFAENVSRRAIDRAADELEAMGYAVRCAEVSAADMGADHVRSRCWLLAHADDDGELLRAINAKAPELQGVAASLWSSEPGCLRVPDGVAARVDRLKAIGNGQVPSVAATAWKLLTENSLGLL
jgi:DNA (cytosine-5)-methyltransferase 1